ncbi:MAG: DUF2628 domain-containing protein [Lentilitoribacter sp.]
MKPYLILGSKTATNASELIAVGDKFSWLAALFAPFWFLWRGMWLHALLAFVALSFIGGISAGFESQILSAIAQIVLSLWFGFEARYFYIEHLQRQGAPILGTYLAFDAQMAMELHLDVHPFSDQKHQDGSNIITSYDKAYHADMIFGGN